MEKCKENKPCKVFMELVSGEDTGLMAYRSLELLTYQSRVRLMYRTRSAGLILVNYCPWCGVPQVWAVKKKKPQSHLTSKLKTVTPKKKQITARKKK